jgi:hypothetical protein
MSEIGKRNEKLKLENFSYNQKLVFLDLLELIKSIGGKAVGQFQSDSFFNLILIFHFTNLHKRKFHYIFEQKISIIRENVLLHQMLNHFVFDVIICTNSS